MLVRLLLRSLIIELLVYAVGGLLLWRYANLTWGSAVLLALTLFLGLRAFNVTVLFVVAWRYRAKRDIERRLSWSRACGLFVAEWGSMLALYSFFHLLEPWLMRQERDTEPNQSTTRPILLIHGYFCNAAFWWSMARYLRRRGLENVHTITLEPVFGDIEHYAIQVKERIEKLCAATGAAQVILLGHSMGGLVARTYWYHYAEQKRLAGIITLGTPHHGTIHAQFSLAKSRNVEQLLPNSALLKELNREEAQPCPIPIVSVYSYHDDLVTPQSSSILNFPNAQNIGVVGVGHLAMAFDRSFHALIYAQLTQLLNK